MVSNNIRVITAIALIFVTLVLVGESHAVPYSEVSMFDNVTQTSPFYSYSYVNYSVSIYNITSSSFNLSFQADIKNLNVTNLNRLGLSDKTYPASDCHTFSVSVGCEILQINNVKDNETLYISYDYYQNYTNVNGSFNSTIYFMPSSFTRLLNVNMILPNNAYIPDNEYSEPTLSSILPLNNRFEVEWKLINQSYPNVGGYYIDLPFTINYDLKIKYTKPAQYPYIYDLIIPIIIVATIAMGLNYYLRRKRPLRNRNAGNKLRSKSLIYGILSTDEKKLLNAIDKIGFTHQSDIIKITGFSKIKVSKIISKLSRYRLIKIKQDGRTNKIKRV